MSGDSETWMGGYGQTHSHSGGNGVTGHAEGVGAGVAGQSTEGFGVIGEALGAASTVAGFYGVMANGDGAGPAVLGENRGHGAGVPGARARGERYAVFSSTDTGRIVLVVEIDDLRDVGGGKFAIVGTVLAAGNPVYDGLIGQPSLDRFRIRSPTSTITRSINPVPARAAAVAWSQGSGSSYRATTSGRSTTGSPLSGVTPWASSAGSTPLMASPPHQRRLDLSSWRPARGADRHEKDGEVRASVHSTSGTNTAGGPCNRSGSRDARRLRTAISALDRSPLPEDSSSMFLRPRLRLEDPVDDAGDFGRAGPEVAGGGVEAGVAHEGAHGVAGDRVAVGADLRDQPRSNGERSVTGLGVGQHEPGEHGRVVGAGSGEWRDVPVQEGVGAGGD